LPTIQKRREQVNLSLRKEKVFNFIMEKRFSRPEMKSYFSEENLFLGISIESINIPEEELIIYEKKVNIY
jgi:hypothetical protein